MAKLFVPLVATTALLLAGCMDEETVKTSETGASAPKEVAKTATASRASSDVFEVRPKGSFIISEGSFGKYGEMVTVMQARNIGGKTAICGAGYLNDVGGSVLFKKMMRDVAFQINGQTVLSRMSHVKLTGGGFDRTGMLSCRFVDTPWQPGFENSSNWSTKLRGSGRYKL